LYPKPLFREPPGKGGTDDLIFLRFFRSSPFAANAGGAAVFLGPGSLLSMYSGNVNEKARIGQQSVLDLAFSAGRGEKG
jgi:hypothetical protein